MLNKIRKSFTLAEVLITLSIIGVLAALTMPGLIQDTNQKELVSKLLKVNATLSQATTMIKIDNGGTLVDAFSGTNNMRNKYKVKISGVKECTITNSDCWHADGAFYNLQGDSWYQNYYNDRANLIGSDGVLYHFMNSSPDCTFDYSDTTQNSPFEKSCGWVVVDINGFTKPNKMGVDIFRFWITQNGIYPFGTKGEPRYASPGSYCNKDSIQNDNGDGCAGIVIRTKAMDYLK